MKSKKTKIPRRSRQILPQIGITLGDPGGVGPEIVAKIFSGGYLLPQAHYFLFGSSLVLDCEEKALGIKLRLCPWDERTSPSSPGLHFVEVKNPLKRITTGISTPENGLASFLFFQAAVRAARRGDIQAVVTAPISKKAWNLAGVGWKGHTDYLGKFYPQAIMAFWSERMKVALLSHHLSLRDALEKVKKKNLLRHFLLLHQSLEKIQPGKYGFLVSGLNPHAGEDGLLGDEEIEEIIPAVEEARKNGMRISGPFPPDAIFRMALGKPDTIVIALYHDQGLIAFKLEAFATGVNLSLGLPFIRTSPDHGTAFDIAGRGVANPQSMVAAIKLAYELSSRSL